MMRREKFAIAKIYVPVKRRATLKPETVQEIRAEYVRSRTANTDPSSARW